MRRLCFSVVQNALICTESILTRWKNMPKVAI